MRVVATLGDARLRVVSPLLLARLAIDRDDLTRRRGDVQRPSRDDRSCLHAGDRALGSGTLAAAEITGVTPGRADTGRMPRPTALDEARPGEEADAGPEHVPHRHEPRVDPAVATRRAVALVVLTLLAPGLAQYARGNRAGGRVALRV